MNISWDINIWIGVFLTFAILSFLYRDNPFYRFAESLFIGVSAGYIFCLTVFNVIAPKVAGSISENSYIYIFPTLLGILLLTRVSPKYGWLSRYPLAIFIGIYAGMNIIYYTKSFLIDQLAAGMTSLVVFDASGRVNYIATLNSVITLTGVISVLIYFCYSRKDKILFKKVGDIGIVYIMVAFGASFGYTVMARISLLIGRLNFIVVDWLGIIR